MKKIAWVLTGVVVLLLAAVAFVFRGATLPVDPIALTTLPDANPPGEMWMAALPTGTMSSKAAFAYAGGSFSDERTFAMTPVLVHHPKGDLLIDTGFGSQIETHLKTLPSAARSSARFNFDQPVAMRLLRANYDLHQLKGVILTHAHWDHCSGLGDLPDVPVWLNADEQAFIASGNPFTQVMRDIKHGPTRPYAFGATAYLGYPRSFDVYGDGSIVLVPAPGHTPGSIIVFVTLPRMQRYAFIGDVAWQNEGVDLPAERPLPVRAVIDSNPAQVRAELSHLAGLHARFPELHIMPAHDARAFAALPLFPAR